MRKHLVFRATHLSIARESRKIEIIISNIEKKNTPKIHHIASLYRLCIIEIENTSERWPRVAGHFAAAPLNGEKKLRVSSKSALYCNIYSCSKYKREGDRACKAISDESAYRELGCVLLGRSTNRATRPLAERRDSRQLAATHWKKQYPAAANFKCALTYRRVRKSPTATQKRWAAAADRQARTTLYEWPSLRNRDVRHLLRCLCADNYY